jgi:hypothetical protein
METNEVCRRPMILALHLETHVSGEMAKSIRDAFAPEIERMRADGHSVYGFVVSKGMRLSCLNEPPADDRLTKLAQAWWDHGCGVLDEDQSEEATQIAMKVLGIGDGDDE